MLSRQRSRRPVHPIVASSEPCGAGAADFVRGGGLAEDLALARAAMWVRLRSPDTTTPSSRCGDGSEHRKNPLARAGGIESRMLIDFARLAGAREFFHTEAASGIIFRQQKRIQESAPTVVQAMAGRR